MRRYYRLQLPPKAVKSLKKKQAETNREHDDHTLKVDVKWGQARQSKSISYDVINILRQMTDNRHRCMYCEKSHGTSIEHFWPKSRYYQKAFDWLNMLLCCAECQNIKGDEFPVDQQDNPLLIDPTQENPWEYIEFDCETGNLTSRFDLATSSFFPKVWKL